MALKLGRKPARADDPKLHLHAYLNRAELPPLPNSTDWSVFVKTWPMLDNDKLGDCVPAVILHSAQLATAIAANEYVPTDADAVALYEAIGGYVPGDPATDGGCVMFDAMQYLVNTG